MESEKKYPFQKVQKPLDCITRFGGKHYPNALLELLFVCGQLVLQTWTPPQTTQRVTWQVFKMFVQCSENMKWRRDAVPLKAAGLSGRN